MANSAINIASSSTGSGNMPFLLYEPGNVSKKQPLILFLHGAGEGTSSGGAHNTTTVRTIEGNGKGIMAHTRVGTLPSFTDPITGEEFEFYMIAPQLYNPPGQTPGQYQWQTTYITTLIPWAIANLNVDPTRVYLTGLSLGGGGSIIRLCEPAVQSLIAACAIACPGAGNGSSLDHAGLARTGIPIWMVAAADDYVPGVNNTIIQIANRLNNLTPPLFSPKVYWYLSGGHNIWDRLYTLSDNTSWPGFNGEPCIHEYSIFRWFLQYTKKDKIAPIYN